ncbi:MAG TPA: hypothetical protein VG319_00910 [Polyangia bacterium]|jgi:hypothetical protein|nr:hypothetical protein [Polyangia bacterium]
MLDAPSASASAQPHPVLPVGGGVTGTWQTAKGQTWAAASNSQLSRQVICAQARMDET